MSIYGQWLFPSLIDWTMRAPQLSEHRRRVVQHARGQVLEIGIGSGMNLPFYGGGVERLVGLDPSPQLLERARRLLWQVSFPVDLLQGSAQAIPVRDASFDSTVMTWSLCSIDDPLAALAEIRRVLGQGGELLFVEHGLAPDPGMARWQHRLDPLWARVSCHLDRPVQELLKQAGFRVAESRSGYLPIGPRWLTYCYEGRARPM